MISQSKMVAAGAHYQIPQEPGRSSAFILAGLMHVLLFMFLWFGIRWQSKEPMGVDAEIWDVTTREAAPAPIIEIPPPVVEQPEQKPTEQQVEQEKLMQEKLQEEEIVIKRAKAQTEKENERKLKEDKLKQEKQDKKDKKDALLKEKHDKDQKKLAAAQLLKQQKEDAQLDQQRDETLKNMLKSSGGSGDAAKSTGNNRVDPSYAGKIAAKIKSNMVYVGADNGTDNPTVEFRIELFPDGSLRGVPHKTKSSGVPAFDDQVERAITKSAPYPADKSGVVPTVIPLTYRLKD